jgi:AraC family transcriptional activator FtrA
VRWYDFAVCAAERGSLRAAGGITVNAPNSIKLLTAPIRSSSRLA